MMLFKISKMFGNRFIKNLTSSFHLTSPFKANLCSNFEHDKMTYFGFQTVSKKEKAQKVNQVFTNVASKYDVMNDIMSAGYHRIWKNQLINTLDPIIDTQLIDVAGGTGDVAFRFIDKIKKKYFFDLKSKVIVCDINQKMLDMGKARSLRLGYEKLKLIEWINGDAQNLPFLDNTFDAYTIAFGIRNVIDINQALKEAYRVLKPGGMFLCLEFSKLSNPILKPFYDWYSFNLIPVFGELISGDWKSYQYLVESIRKFPDQTDFAEMIKEAGFGLVEFQNLSQGIAAIHSGFKKD